jgi:succinate-acetate transporter protein
MASRLVKRGVFEEIEGGENDDLKFFKEIQSSLSQPKATPSLGNPAAIGLGAFGATTILLQLHNLELAGTGVVMWLAFFFGGLAQFIAGLQEFRTGNSFGSAAFVTYGAFWIALGGIFLSIQMGLFNITGTDVGWFLVVFTGLTLIYFIGSLKQSSALSWVFLTLFIGFVLLDIGHLVPGASIFNKIAAVELIVCALCAWYLMAHVILTPLKINIPAGKAWIK